MEEQPKTHDHVLHITGLKSLDDCSLAPKDGGIRVALLRRALSTLGLPKVPTSRNAVCKELRNLDRQTRVTTDSVSDIDAAPAVNANEADCNKSLKDGGPRVADLRARAKALGVEKVPKSRAAICKVLANISNPDAAQVGKATASDSGDGVETDACEKSVKDGGPCVADLRAQAKLLGATKVPQSRAAVCQLLKTLSAVGGDKDEPQVAAVSVPKPASSYSAIGEHAVHTAARTNDTGTLKRLLKQDRTLSNLLGVGGKTPLIYATLSKALPAVKLLLQFGANVNLGDLNGDTALHHVAHNTKEKHEHTIALEHAIINDRNAIVDVKNLTGVTPLYYALRAQNLTAAALLIDSGANLRQLILDGLVDVSMIPNSLATSTKKGLVNDALLNLPDDIDRRNNAMYDSAVRLGDKMRCQPTPSVPWQSLPRSEQVRSLSLMRFKNETVMLADCDLSRNFENWQLVGDKNSASTSWISFADLNLPQARGANQAVVLKLAFVSRNVAKDNSLEIERVIYRDVTNPLFLGGHTPHVMLCYGIVGCDNFMEKMRAIGRFNATTKRLCKQIDKDVQANRKFEQLYNKSSMRALILEKSQGKSIYSKIVAFGRVADEDTNHSLASRHRKVFETLYLPFFFQLCYTLAAFQDVGLQHNDMHGNNIFIEKYLKPQRHTYKVDGQHFTLTSHYQARIFDFDRAHKESTAISPCQLENRLTDALCHEFGQCNVQNSRTELFRALHNLYRTNKRVASENVQLSALIEFAIPKDLLLLQDINDVAKAGHVNQPDIAFVGNLCYCEDDFCMPCTVKTDARIKTPREILQSNFFRRYRVETPSDDAFVWTLPAEKQ